MIYIIHTISVLLKITWTTLKIVFSNAYSREYNRPLFLFYFFNFFSQYKIKKSSMLGKDRQQHNLRDKMFLDWNMKKKIFTN